MEVAGTPNEAQESNMLIENIENDKTSTTERKKDEPDERWEKGEGELPFQWPGRRGGRDLD